MKRRSGLLTLLISLFFLISAQGFEVITNTRNPADTPFAWPPSSIPVLYYIHKNGTPDISGTQEFGQIKKSLAVWNRVFKLKFQFAGTTSNVEFGDMKNGIIFDQKFIFDSSVIAYLETVFYSNDRKTRVEGDLHLNDRDFKWTLGPSSANAIRILPVAVHEMGHSVGLLHSAVPTASMFYAFFGDAMGSLHNDDKEGAKFIYNGPFNTGSAPRLLTPLNGTAHYLLTSGQAARGITFRWTQNDQSNLTNFLLQFAGDSAFTLNFKQFSMGLKEAKFVKGSNMNALRNIQALSPEDRIYWRVTALQTDGTTVTSIVLWFRLT